MFSGAIDSSINLPLTHAHPHSYSLVSKSLPGAEFLPEPLDDYQNEVRSQGHVYFADI